MSYEEEWQGISFRIRSLIATGTLYAHLQAASSSDPYKAGAELGEQCKALVMELERFLATYRSQLPAPAVSAIERFLATKGVGAVKTESDNARAARAGLVVLPAFESELTHLLSGRQELIRLRTARALQHLQQVLVVDTDVRTKWRQAFDGKGEISCEQLGAVHLMLHGVYTFKAHASGARTDLVLGDPINLETVAKVSEGLVLTEWKVANPGETVAKFNAARAQADIYAGGMLGGFELRNHRYLIVVTIEQAPKDEMPPDVTVNGITYHHINVAIDPRSPSKEAARTRRKK